MLALETLNLDNNNLYAFSFPGTYLPNLRSLSLQLNLIKSFSKITMEQINQHAQKANQSITIDLRQNPLLCTCNERDFVHWIQNAKTYNLHFRGIEDLQCLNSESNSMKILDVDLGHMAIHCLSASVYVSISITAAVLLSAVIVFSGITLYRKRWWFCYKYFIVTKSPRCTGNASSRKKHREIMSTMPLCPTTPEMSSGSQKNFNQN